MLVKEKLFGLPCITWRSSRCAKIYHIFWKLKFQRLFWYQNSLKIIYTLWTTLIWNLEKAVLSTVFVLKDSLKLAGDSPAQTLTILKLNVWNSVVCSGAIAFHVPSQACRRCKNGLHCIWHHRKWKMESSFCKYNACVVSLTSLW